MPPPRDPNSFIFLQFSAKSLKNNPTLGVDAPPPQENPGSAIAILHDIPIVSLQTFITLHKKETEMSFHNAQKGI